MPTKKKSLGSVLRKESRRFELIKWPIAGMIHKWEICFVYSFLIIMNIAFPCIFLVGLLRHFRT